MRRVSKEESERGATAILFALVLLVLLGFVGAGVDVASAYARTQEVQNGADAAALGVAQLCADSGCPSDDELAKELTERNIRLVPDDVTTSVTYPSANRVNVIAGGKHQNFFLGLFDQSSFQIREEATASWGYPKRGIAALPLAFSVCSFEAQGGASGNHVTIFLDKAKSAEEFNCLESNSDNAMPGGFGYIDDGEGLKVCGRHVSADGWIAAQTGNSAKGCKKGDIALDTVVLLPVYDFCWTDKKNAKDCEHDPDLTPPGYTKSQSRWYHIEAFAAFRLTGYNFNNVADNAPAACKGSENCVSGAFVEYVSIDNAWEYGDAPDFGASVVGLVD